MRSCYLPFEQLTRIVDRLIAIDTALGSRAKYGESQSREAHVPDASGSLTPGRRMVGAACVSIAALILVGWGWLYLELLPQINKLSDFERKHSGGGSLLATMDFPAEQRELDTIIYRETINKCKELHDCSQRTIETIRMNFDSMRRDFSMIVRDARSNWEDKDSPSPGPVSRAILSPFCRVISFGYKPEEIGRATAILIAPPFAVVVLAAGMIALSPKSFRFRSKVNAKTASI